MKTVTTIVVIGLCLMMGAQRSVRQSTPRPAMHDATAQTYEHLATAIIEIRATENSLVRGILLHSFTAANNHLQAAMRGRNQPSHLERAATEITNIANEGDKAVQAVRQRLLKAGHHHHTDSTTDEDYMFIDSGEKRALIALARRVSQLGPNAEDAQIQAVADELGRTFDAAISGK